MKMIKIKINFSRMNEAILLLSGQTILEALTDNNYFVTLVKEIDKLKELLGNYSTCVVLSKTRDKKAIANKNDCVTALVDHLEVLGLYVSAVAVGDISILATSGYELKKSKGSGSKKATNPLNVVVVRGAAADEAEISVKQKRGFLTFNFEYTTQDPSTVKNPVWIRKASDAKKFLFTGLPLETKLWFRAEAVGTNGQTVYSNNILYIAY